MDSQEEDEELPVHGHGKLMHLNGKFRFQENSPATHLD